MKTGSQCVWHVLGLAEDWCSVVADSESESADVFVPVAVVLAVVEYAASFVAAETVTVGSAAAAAGTEKAAESVAVELAAEVALAGVTFGLLASQKTDPKQEKYGSIRTEINNKKCPSH